MELEKPLLILVTGKPATGKTFFAKLLSERFNLPVISKDAIKEILFDTLGTGDREWSKKLGKSTFAIMDAFLESELKASHSCILESPLNPEFENEKFKRLQSKYDFSAVQIIFHTNPDVLFDRFKRRAETAERHSGHDELNNLDEFKQSLSTESNEVIAINSEIFTIDTTDLSNVDYEPVISYLNSLSM